MMHFPLILPARISPAPMISNSIAGSRPKKHGVCAVPKRNRGTMRRACWHIVGLIVLLVVTTASAHGEKLRADYTVKVASIDKQLFHITTDIKNISADYLDLSLPVWTPGWYT